MTYQTCKHERRKIISWDYINFASDGHRERVVPLHVFVKVMGTIANVHEGGIDLLPLQAGVAREGLGAKVVLHYTTVFAEPRAAALVH